MEEQDYPQDNEIPKRINNNNTENTGVAPKTQDTKNSATSSMGLRTDKVDKNRGKKRNVIIVSVLTAVAVLFIGVVGLFTYQEAQRTQKLSEITAKLKDEQLSAEEVKEQQKLLEELKQQKDNDLINSVSGGLGFGESNNTERLNILLMGLDSREDDLVGRTDTLMLFSYNQATGVVDMISIPRDMYVEIVGKGYNDKINHSFAFGGEEMTIATVEKFLDVEIDHHVVFNFQGFMGIIDALGGVEVDVPFAFTEQDSKGRHYAVKFDKGVQTLNGEQALAYARMRKQDPRGDIGRGERQQQIIKATIDELKQMQSIGTYINVYNAVNSSINTDLGIRDIPSFVPKVKSIQSFNSISLQGSGTSIKGVYYMLPNEAHLNEVKALLQTEEVLEEEVSTQ